MEPRASQWAYTDSLFWKEVERSGNLNLQSAVKDIVQDSTELAKLVGKALPTFTLHDDTHLRNVLYWMEQFVTDEGLNELGPVGCALCMVLAYVHDLGMVPEPDWEAKLADSTSSEHARFHRFASERHADLLNLLDKCRHSPGPEEPPRAAWIEGFLRADYLRATHASSGEDGRVGRHLRALGQTSALKKLYEFLCAEEAAICLIAELAASHNESVDWLARRRQVADKDSAQYWRFNGGAGTTNIVLPVLLLRLADLCDFDASRTPRILFHQLGIEGFAPLGIQKLDEAQTFTHGEWMKHLAVNRWEWNAAEGDKLSYIASDCPHPAVEKTIRQFCRTIETEIQGVRRELDRVFQAQGRAWLRLPESVQAVVKPRGYVYHDVEFQLQAHEVTELLMGTALYGNPELCIRELLQNALDAVQLRDMRQQLKQKLEDAGRGHELPVPVEAWTKTEREQPKIKLDWGRDAASQREWLRVSDLGTGMTLDQIQRYLSALGRSYYKSPEFDAERQLMRRHGLVSTPISQFGIGILSCFMLAEWIEIHTCPCQNHNPDRQHHDPARQAWHIRITGPGALFHFSESGDALRPGTQVKLYLKPEFSIEEIQKVELVKRLREEMGYVGTYRSDQSEANKDDGVRRFNPARVAARHVIWPRYDIQAGPVGQPPLLVLRDRWHFDELIPLDGGKLQDKAREWDCPPERVAGVQWHVWDWHDGVTGSRIRLALPQCDRPVPGEGAGILSQRRDRLRAWEIAVMTEPQLNLQNRERYLVRGMWVPNMDQVKGLMTSTIGSGLGSWVWVDVCGETAPRLTADRARGLVASGNAKLEWEKATNELFARWIQHLASETNRTDNRTQLLSLMVSLAGSVRQNIRPPAPTEPKWSLFKSSLSSWSVDTERVALWLLAVFLMEIGKARSLARDRARALARDRALDLDLDLDLARVRALALDRALDRALALDRDRDRDLALARARARALALALARDLARALDRALGKSFSHSLQLSFLNEAFWPSLPESFPPLGLPAPPEGLSAALHLAPTVLWFGTGDGAEKRAAARWQEIWGYDLLMPFSAVAGPPLLRRFSQWVQDRYWRSLLTLPFLMPDEELVREISEAVRKDEDCDALVKAGLYALLPRPDLWEKPFADWTEEDCRWGGYSVWWDIANGRTLWAVGTVIRADIANRGQPLDAFLDSPGLKAYREHSPGLFEVAWE